jgi:hypothetical protein
MPEFGEAVGPFVNNLLRSIKEEAEGLPSFTEITEKLKEFEPTPEEITEVASKCADAVVAAGKVLADLVHGVHNADGDDDDPMPDHIDIPDDLSDLD